MAGECRAFKNLGATFKAMGMIERSVQSYQKHLHFIKSLEDTDAEAKAYDTLGNALHKLGSECSTGSETGAKVITTLPLVLTRLSPHPAKVGVQRACCGQ